MKKKEQIDKNQINDLQFLLKSIREPDIKKVFENNSIKNKNDNSKKEKNTIPNYKQNNNKQNQNNDIIINNMKYDYNILNN